jgi:hypothetical protein
LQDIESEAPQEITQFTEKSNLLDGSNEPVQVRGGRIRRAGAYIAVGALIILALGCLDLMFILRGKPVVQIDTAHLDLGSSTTADASLNLQGHFGSESNFHSVEVGTSKCSVRYDEFGQPGGWSDMITIVGRNAGRVAGGGAQLLFDFRDTDFSTVRHFLYDAVWNRPTGAAIHCEVNINIYAYRIVPVPCTLEVEVIALAPTTEKTIVSFVTSGSWAGHTMFETVSTAEFNRTTVDPHAILRTLQTMSAKSPFSDKNPRSIAHNILGMFNHSSPKNVNIDVSMENPLYGGSEAPLSSFVLSVPALTVTSTSLGDVENGGRFFLSSTGFSLELMQPALRLATRLSLQCSESFPSEADPDSPVVLTDCSMPGPNQAWQFFRALADNRIHLVVDAVSPSFVTNLAGPHHSVVAELTNSTQTDASLREFLAKIDERKASNAKISAVRWLVLHGDAKTKQNDDTDIHFMGYGVSTHGSCINIDADNVFRLLGCASLRPGLVKFRMHLLNEEGVLVAALLRNVFATEGTAEILTEIRANMDGGNSFQWNSTISESERRSVFDFALRADTEEKIRSHIDVNWNLTDDNTRRNALDMRGRIVDRVFTHDDDIHVQTVVHYGLDSFDLRAGLKDISFAAAGNYEFTKHLTFDMNLRECSLVVNRTEMFMAHALLRSEQRRDGRDHQDHTANVHSEVRVVADNKEYLRIAGSGVYGKEFENR